MVFRTERAIERALAEVRRGPARPMPGVRALIVPHHWLAGRLIVGALRDLAATREFRRVVLVGPNHIGVGRAAVATSDRAWQTPFGEADPDAASVRWLLARGLVELEPDVLTYEHSIAGIVPAIHRLLPGARILPIALRGRIDGSSVTALASDLVPMMDDGTVLIASVDFSHYLPALEASRRDLETIEALRALDAARILSFGNEHLDSPPSIALVIETVRALGAMSFDVRENASSPWFGAPARGGVTSYVVGYFR
jgi:hypothetical protein